MNKGLEVDQEVGQEIGKRVRVFLDAFLSKEDIVILQRLTVFKATFSEKGAFFVMKVCFWSCVTMDHVL